MFSSWRNMRLNVGEPYMLTSRLAREQPNGSPCVIKTFTRVPAASVRNQFRGHMTAIAVDALTRQVAWGPVAFNFPTAALFTADSTMVDVALHALERFIQNHSSGPADEVILPILGVRTPTDVMQTRVLHPALEMETADNGALVACRVQMPLVPAAVRVAAGMLSSTSRPGNRVVIHSTGTGDTTMSEDAHNAPLFVAMTRVTNAKDLALTGATVIHANMCEPRHALRDLARFCRSVAGADGENCKLYHCQALGHDGQPAPLHDGEEHDVVLHAQMGAGFFEGDAAVAQAYVGGLPEPEVVSD